MGLKKYRKIRQMKDCIKGLILRYQYVEDDENGDPIYDETRELPTLTFKGTVKLHGRNQGIEYNRKIGELVSQSRNTSYKDTLYGSQGFVEYVRVNETFFKELLDAYCDKMDSDHIYLFGEWCGQGIQRKVSISELPKRFVIFDVYDAEKEVYLDHSEIDIQNDVERKLYSVHNYKTYEVSVDLNNPQKACDEMNQYTSEVEKVCPISKEMIMEEISEKPEAREEYLGEGIVWRFKGHTLKTKGEKHSKGGGAKKATLDPIKAKSVEEFVSKTVTEDRLDQCWNAVSENHNEPIGFRQIGELMKWIFDDIMTEEGDALYANNLEAKDVRGAVSNTARTWFIEKLNNF